MSVAVSRCAFAAILEPQMPSSSPADFLSGLFLSPELREKPSDPPTVTEEKEDALGQFDIWNSIQAQKAKQAEEQPTAPYVHPLVRRSSSGLLSQKSLEICTESLGSETGSDGFSSSDDMDFPFFAKAGDEEDDEEQEEEEEELPVGRKGVALVNYHCSVRRRSPTRFFPPPLPSISRRDGSCLHMRPHRRDGRLVVEAVPVPSQNYLHAERQGGRLLLSFVNAAISAAQPIAEHKEYTTEASAEDLPQLPRQHLELDQVDESESYKEEEKAAAAREEEEEEDDDEDEEEEEEEEEEEVEVVERGTVVEVKVSTQPQQQSGAAKVFRSSLVINKFVGATPVGNQDKWAEERMAEDEAQTRQEDKYAHFTLCGPLAAKRVGSAISTAAAAAAVAESALSATGGAVRDYGLLPRLAAQHGAPDNKVLFTSKRRNRAELLRNMRRCSQLRRQLFIWEPYGIATST